MTRTEQLLYSALAPVEPPHALSERVERRLTALTAHAAEELADWELRAMRDPRNWARPAAAVVIGGLAGGALVMMRARQNRKHLAATAEPLRRSAREVAGEVRRRLST